MVNFRDFLSMVDFFKVRFVDLKKASQMMWDEWLSVAYGDNFQEDLYTNDSAALQGFFPLNWLL